MGRKVCIASVCIALTALAGCASDAVRPEPTVKVVHAPPKIIREPVALTDQQIAAIIVQGSIATYIGPCPCPESPNPTCKRRNAYQADGGQKPFCYPSDVRPELIQKARQELAANR